MGSPDGSGAPQEPAVEEAARGRLAARSLRVASSPLALAAGLVLGIQVATGVVRFATQVLFARWGGPDQYGEYAYAFGWTTLLVIPATLGLTLSVLRYVPEYAHDERWALLRGLLRRSFQVTAVSGALFSAAGIGLVLVLGGSSEGPLLFGMALISVVSLVTLVREMTRGTQRVALAYGTGDLLPMTLALAIALGLAASGSLSGEEMLIATGIGFLVALGVQWMVLRRSLPKAFSPVVRPSYDVRKWLTLSVPLWFVGIFTLVINQSDLLVLGALEAPAEVGVYAAGSKTAFLVSFVLVAVGAVLAPRIVRHHAAGDKVALRNAVRSGTRLIMWPSVAVGGVLFLFPDIVLTAFGEGFEDSSTILRILIVGQLFNAFAGPAGYVLLLTGAQTTAAKVYGVAAAADVALLVTLVPAHGIQGAAVATATTIAVTNCVLYGIMRRRLAALPAG